MKTELIPVTLRLSPSKVERTPGVHVSAIIRAIAAKTGILKPEWVEEADFSLQDTREITDPRVLMRIALGQAWEDWYITNQLPDVVDHPGELVLDNVYMSPDGESIERVITDTSDGYCVCIHEVKATYKSLKTIAPRMVTGNLTDPPDLVSQWMWLAQTMSYCKAAGTRIAFLHVMLICGAYKFPLEPLPLCWRIEYTQAELDENWDAMLAYRDYRVAFEAGEVGEL